MQTGDGMPRAATEVGMRDVRDRFRRCRLRSFFVRLDGTRIPSGVAKNPASELTLHGGSTPRGSQASSLMSCLFQGCCLAPEGGAPAYWTLTPARCGVGSSKQPPLVAERTPSKTRYCFYPWERLTTEPANSLRLVRCKMSDRTIPAHASGTGNAGRTCG